MGTWPNQGQGDCAIALNKKEALVPLLYLVIEESESWDSILLPRKESTCRWGWYTRKEEMKETRNEWPRVTFWIRHFPQRKPASLWTALYSEPTYPIFQVRLNKVFPSLATGRVLWLCICLNVLETPVIQIYGKTTWERFQMEIHRYLQQKWNLRLDCVRLWGLLHCYARLCFPTQAKFRYWLCLGF